MAIELSCVVESVFKILQAICSVFQKSHESNNIHRIWKGAKAKKKEEAHRDKQVA